MKAFNQLLKGSGLLIMVLVVTLLFINGCTKQDLAPVSLDENLIEMNSESKEINSKGPAAVFEDVCLKGTSNFDVYSPKESRVVVSPDEMFLSTEATLKQVEGQNYLLTVEEYMPLPEGPMLYRIIEFEVKITGGGVVMFSWPKTWWELEQNSDDLLGQLLAHTGCIVHGPGVNKGTLDYKGYFDGEKFQASTHFIGKQVQNPMMPVYEGLDGPIQFEFSMTLEKVECTTDK